MVHKTKLCGKITIITIVLFYCVALSKLSKGIILCFSDSGRHRIDIVSLSFLHLSDSVILTLLYDPSKSEIHKEI